MSQVFSADSVNVFGSTTVTLTTETTLVTGNFLSPPFGNAKAVVSANAQLTVGTGTTSVRIIVRRNPNAENVAVMNLNFINVTAGNAVLLAGQVADPIPDGRPVQYAFTCTQNGATGNGTVNFANVTAMLISG